MSVFFLSPWEHDSPEDPVSKRLRLPRNPCVETCPVAESMYPMQAYAGTCCFWDYEPYAGTLPVSRIMYPMQEHSLFRGI